MPVERHRIGREVIEITTRRESDARHLKRRLGPLQRSRLERLIDRCCTEAGRPGVLYRIDRLEIDLGRFQLQQLAEALPAKLEAELKAAIASQVREQDARTRRGGLEPEMAARLELVEIFTRTGTLPWWADTSRRDIVDRALRRLVRGGRRPTPRSSGTRWAEPGGPVPGLRRWLRRLLRAPERLARLVRHTGDDTLMMLVETLGAGGPVETARVSTLLRRTKTMPGVVPARSRVAAWSGLLAAADAVERTPRPVDRWRDTLARMALDLGLGYGEVLAKLRARAGDEPRGSAMHDDPLEQILVELAGEPSPTRAARGGPVKPLSRADGHRTLLRLAESPGPLRPLFAQLRATAERIPGGAPVSWAGPLRELAESAGRTGPETASALRRMLEALVADERIPAALLERYPLRRLEAASPAGLAQAAEVAARAVARSASRAKPSGRTERREGEDPEYADANAVYVENAGLVLLGPFLPRFFERQNLVADDRFRDLAAQRRATALLQYLVTETPAPPEYQLALNKILCGLRVTDPLEIEDAPGAEETAECGALLESVIEHAGLGRMSIDGFRGTFLLRSGVISARDSSWVLHVERAEYDVLLDRLPWSTDWVRHPWMMGPLKVEW